MCTSSKVIEKYGLQSALKTYIYDSFKSMFFAMLLPSNITMDPNKQALVKIFVM